MLQFKRKCIVLEGWHHPLHFTRLHLLTL